jgi:glutaredoxin-like protein NrdH
MSKLTVTVYTAGPGCMPCRQTKRHLSSRGIAYTEILIDSDDNVLAAILELGFTTAPVVLAATGSGEQSWDGYRPDRIDGLLAS